MLTTTQAASAKPKTKEYNLTCGKVPGLFLRIKPNSSKLWMFNYIRPHTKKRTNIGLGQYSTIPLAEARDIARKYRHQLAQGIDPKVERERLKRELTTAHLNTFEAVAREWFKTKEPDISSTYAFKIMQGLENHVFKSLGSVPVHLINTPDTIQVLKPLEAQGSLVSVRKICRWINEVMNFAVNTGLAPANPLSGILAAFKKPKTKNMATIAPNQIPRLMQAIENANITLTTKCLMEWQLHTMVRPGEAAGTKWEEIDLKAELWTIPKCRMKKGREHIAPLTPQTLAILKDMKPLSGHREHVFPSTNRPEDHANSQTCNMALKRMGFKGELVSHGMRHLASTALNEQRFDHDVIESALSHADANVIRATYNQAVYLEPRKKMMLWWSSHLEEAKTCTPAATIQGLKVVANG